MQQKFIFFVLILITIVTTGPLFAESRTRVTLNQTNNIYGLDKKPYAAYSAGGTARLELMARRNKHVKGELALDFTAGSLPELGALAMRQSSFNLDIARAYIKVRFPALKLMIGKHRLSWGEGVYCNAGDVIFGSTDQTASLTADTLRDEATWLTAINIPLGRFSFLELIAIPMEGALDLYLQDLQLAAQTGQQADNSVFNINRSSAGGRLVVRPGGIKIETGALVKGEEVLSYNPDPPANSGDPVTSYSVEESTPGVLPYLSFQGHLGADLHLSASTKLPLIKWHDEASDSWDKTWQDSLAISAGAYYTVSNSRDHSFNFRLEALCRPWAEWKERAPKADEARSEYALYLYPEFSWSPTSQISVILRSIVSPLDLSALITSGCSWNVYQGLDLFLFGSVQAGEENDNFGLWREGGWSVNSGAKFVF